MVTKLYQKDHRIDWLISPVCVEDQRVSGSYTELVFIGKVLEYWKTCSVFIWLATFLWLRKFWSMNKIRGPESLLQGKISVKYFNFPFQTYSNLNVNQFKFISVCQAPSSSRASNWDSNPNSKSRALTQLH